MNRDGKKAWMKHANDIDINSPAKVSARMACWMYDMLTSFKCFIFSSLNSVLLKENR